MAPAEPPRCTCRDPSIPLIARNPRSYPRRIRRDPVGMRLRRSKTRSFRSPPRSLPRSVRPPNDRRPRECMPRIASNRPHLRQRSRQVHLCIRRGGGSPRTPDTSRQLLSRRSSPTNLGSLRVRMPRRRRHRSGSDVSLGHHASSRPRADAERVPRASEGRLSHLHTCSQAPSHNVQVPNFRHPALLAQSESSRALQRNTPSSSEASQKPCSTHPCARRQSSSFSMTHPSGCA